MEAINQLTHYGVPGLMLALMLLAGRYAVGQIRDILAAHQAERKEWREANNEHIEKFSEVIEKNTAALVTMQQRVDKAECRFNNGRL